MMLASRKLWFVLVLWCIGIAGGLHALMSYKGKSGPQARTPAVWPVNDLLPAPSNKPLLVMFAHPRCPCTKASLAELAALTARTQNTLDVAVLFYEPEREVKAWTNTSTIQAAHAMFGVRVISDKSGNVASQFRVETSGHTVLYGTDGKLLFSGGITGSRGHMGDNAGRDAVLALVKDHSTADFRKTEVFGCELFDQCLTAQTSQKTIASASAEVIVQQLKDRLARNTSRVFVLLMVLQWFGAIAAALLISPRSWQGTSSNIHIHVWAAIVLGGLITALPVGLAWYYPTKVATRHIVAAGQMLMSALLIHITGGRVETHFHVFGSLAILAFYRDWRVLITASLVVYIDHLGRGYYWPQSVYGVLNASPWRAVEHAWWVGFEVAFLCIAIRQSTREMQQIAERQLRLQSFNEEIEAEVRARTAELLTINKQMETFCYSMSHDLKAPLRGIHAFSEILSKEHSENLNDEGKECLKRIQDASGRMNRLLNDLLEYSRVSTAKLPVTPVDLLRSCEEAVRLLSVEIKEENASVTIQPALGSVLGHEATLTQVMLNLIGNALRYRKLGVNPVVNVSSERRDNYVRVLVQDNGVGIAPQYHKKIFEIFERVSESTAQSGTGVGLAIVAKSIERLGGALGVESIPGVGSTFWFELPHVTPIMVNSGSDNGVRLVVDE